MLEELVSQLPVSGARLTVEYRLAGSEADAYAMAQDICVEQTVECPVGILPERIRREILGRVESFERRPDGAHRAHVSYPVEVAGRELTQLLNVIFGNVSLKPGIRVEALALPETILRNFRGPRFGRAGLREFLRVKGRALLATALKPIGLTATGLAELASRCALGGIDVIKDDHGLANQVFADFRERVARCAEAVSLANARTGQRCVYAPNVTAPAGEVLERAHYAKERGAGGLLVAPGLTGFDAMRCLADDEGLSLPILSHPAFQGTYVLSPDHGISHHVLFGVLPRLAGADITIYPNYGGRFSFTRDECKAIVDGAEIPLGGIRPIFPAPGGGMRIDRVPELRTFYGPETVFLIGGDLMSAGPDLIENCRTFRRLLET
jgi:ribulose-bisphosphate carboxylase large chain